MAKGEQFLTLGGLVQNISKIKANQFLYVVLLVAVFLLGYLAARVQMLEKDSNARTPTVQAPQGQQQAPQAPPEKVDVTLGKLPASGKNNAKVAMVEFSDFECPFCERFFKETLPQIKKEYIDTGKVKLTYRHFPLDFHAAAMPAALASECANEQGKFWEYHDKIFTEQSKISGKTGEIISQQLKTWAKQTKLDTTRFNNCLDSEKYKEAVNKDVNDGKTAGVSGTPTFFINGKRLVGAQPFAAFKAVIDEELK
ncbi:MAG: DsbA oxidoreductase [uncultured bacterium]|nr:MAG: DsbA oxidoreductase [uncultured bacterium]KKQ96598.1 MAG: DSBA oxidoreductase [Candidatus Levybacteria bacterium GW2011_GWA1_39_11]OGH14988.1 MAG: hypothetical protein A2689_01170 [Candidatus Levybacteria bacterium RIFCSPHIGHO2_01_FULL_38_96]OGH26051.1 MAG: hypothetical protein A3E68_00750 [Candidatus Levybacteria bacterium RIFCSPHIGHO2_12_FULL_39_39]OGH27802.1 MAG: hypothetical protein A3C27_02980 [Candidatus Levybacteria bacterium RIFCSPHIGHO2_02_FULL_39_36]OGH36055.1 MAG: hypothetic